MGHMKKGDLTREYLLQCAEKSFSRKGYYETQVSDIVKMAGVAKGTIYQYFTGKEAIFKTLLSLYMREWEKAIAVNLKDYGGNGQGLYYAQQYLRHRLIKTADFFRENQDRTNIILRIAVGIHKNFETMLKSFEAKILKVIIDDIELGQRWGHIPRDFNLEIAGNAILGAVLRLSFYYFVLNRKKLDRRKPEELPEEIFKLVSNTIKMG
jgi:TetR/AcrR family transcriptional regulator, fatty acid metabolism regulator protein